MKPVRAFIAIELPPETRKQLSEIQSEIKKQIRDARMSWVNPSNIHLTLQFLGDMDVGQISNIESACAFLKNTSVFDIHLAHLGFFPNPRRPRVFWCGYDEHPTLTEMHSRMANELLQFGLTADEKKFTPHLTLARIKEISMEESKNFSLEVEKIHFDVSHPVRQIVCFQSTLSRVGSIYTPLWTLRLKE